MKKYLPLILIAVGVLVLGLVIFVMVRNSKSQNEEVAEENIPELPQSQWPVVTLTPTNNPDVKGSEGHWLDFKVQKINVPGAASMDYLLVYNTSDGGQQGVPGSVKLTGAEVERKLLMGSESSGKFRYDAGVERGTMTITFRDEDGKSVGKLSTDFHLQSGVTELTSIDGKFTYTLDKVAKSVFFVTMNTFLQPEASEYVVWQNGYGVFASDGKPHTGQVSQ
jgi:hypothetical protein